MLLFLRAVFHAELPAETAVFETYYWLRNVQMRSLILFSILLFASVLYADGEPDWCEVDQNYPMERRGLGCIESCNHWREAAEVKVTVPYCVPEKYEYYTFKDVEYEGEELICVVDVECVSSGGP